MNSRYHAGLTRIEVLVGLAIFGVLAAVVLPPVFEIITHPHGYGGTYVLSNMRQLHIATRQMVLDGETNGRSDQGWPGDTGGTFTNWVGQLVPAYLATNDICKLLTGPGVIVQTSIFPPKMSDGAVIVYAVSSNSPPETVLFSSANFTNSPQGGSPLLKSAKPFGNKIFVVFRKGGDGAVLPKNRVGKTNLAGTYAPPVR